MHSLINWLFFKSVWGVSVIAFALYHLIKKLRKSNEDDIVPFLVAASVAIIGILILPSIPRYAFESSVMNNIANKPWIKIIDKSKIVYLTEPLTWFVTPVSSISLISPRDVLSPGFDVSTLIYNEQPRAMFVDAQCAEREITYAKADNEGIYRQDDKDMNLKMKDAEFDTYCKYDWSSEKKALYESYSTGSRKAE